MDRAELIARAEQEHRLDRSELVYLLEDDEADAGLIAAADRVRHRYVGDRVHLRGLIEFSNICKQNCCYCGLRRENQHTERYRLSAEEIVDFAAKAKLYGYRTVVMQSGEDEYFSMERLTKIVRAVRQLGLVVTLSCGEKSAAEYRAYREAGADRYLMRIETTNRELYSQLHPGMDFDNRLRCLWALRAAGFEVGTGSLLGLPGQTMTDLADDLLFYQQLDADMIGAGPFIPNEYTPLKEAAGGTLALALKFTALTRLLRPDANIPATTALETLHPNARLMGLQAGANVVMPNVTEGDYRRKYALYPGKICVNDTPGQCRGCIEGKIRSIGRSIAQDPGYRQGWEDKK